MISPVSFALLLFASFQTLVKSCATAFLRTRPRYEIKRLKNVALELAPTLNAVVMTEAEPPRRTSCYATRCHVERGSKLPRYILPRIAPGVWKLFRSFVLFFLPLSFITPAVFAEDTRLQALYGGDVRLVAPFREEEEFRIIDGFEPGMREFSVSTGGSFSWEEPRIYTFTLLPKFGWILGTYNKPKGALEFEFEPFLSMVKEPEQYSQEVGATIMFAYNFETGTKLVPFIHAGGGAIHSGMNTGGLSHVRELEDAQGGSVSDADEAKKLLKSRLNAIAQMGLGVKYFFQERTSFNIEYRWRHISDPSTTDDLGIDSMFFLFGLSYFY